MSILQSRVIDSLNGLSEENLSFLLIMIDKYMKPQNNSTLDKNRAGGIKIGMFNGEKYMADGYDFDQDNEEIAKLFEAI